MNIKATGTCRGSGKVFVRFEARNLPEGQTLSIESHTKDDRPFPSSIYELDSVGATKRDFVAVFPILSTLGSQSIIYAVDANGKQLDSASYRFNFSAAKWKSRLNYRIRKELTEAIRDYDRVGAYSKVSMEFWECIEDGDEAIIRGVLRVPYRDDNRLNITCTTANLEELPLQVTILGDSKAPVNASKTEYRREVQFSFRVPNIAQRYVFSLKDSNHPSFDNFEVLDGPMFEQQRNSTSFIMLSAQEDPGYNGWFEANKTTIDVLAKQKSIHLAAEPSFSIVVPLYKTPRAYFTDMVSSVRQQTYGNWELILVNASPEDDQLGQLVNEATNQDSRIHSVALESNLGISENTNKGIAQASGDFICFFDHDDLLEPDILFEYAQAINKTPDTDVLYCDEDKLMPSGEYSQPFFKSDFNIDLLRNNNYICHMLTIRKTLLDQLEPNTSEFDGAQDHNMILQASEKARHIYHVPKVLYHWRMSENSTASNAGSKSYATEAGIKAVKNHLERVGLSATVSATDRPFTYRVVYDVPKSHPLVSIIIPSKDHSDVLDTCIQSIISKTTYDNYEIVVIENNSSDSKTFEYYEAIQKTYPSLIRVEYWPAEFNFSKLMNFGAKKAKGDYFLLLNNDTEVITPRWIDVMLGLCARNDVGIVGVRLLYKDNTIQHAGVCVNGMAAGHLGKNLPRGRWGYFALRDAQQDLSAVTAACLMTTREAFESVGGFTEQLSVAFNDIDYCLKVREKGLLVVYTPEVELYHYESLSRGSEDDTDKRLRFHREISYLNYRWAEYYVEGDPYIGPNINGTEPLNYYYHL